MLHLTFVYVNLFLGLDFGASSSLPVSSTVHQFEDATKTASFMVKCSFLICFG